MTQRGAEDLARAQEYTGRAGRLLTNAGMASAQMAADAALGLGNAMIPMMIRSYGAGAQEARQKGYSTQQQAALGLAGAATEYFTEKLFGGNPLYDEGAGLVNKLVGKITSNQNVLAALDSLPAGLIGEGLEEMISDVLNPVAEWAVTGNRPEYELDQIIEDGAVGMLAAAISNAGGAIVSTAARPFARDTGAAAAPPLAGEVINDTPVERTAQSANMTAQEAEQALTNSGVVPEEAAELAPAFAQMLNAQAEQAQDELNRESSAVAPEIASEVVRAEPTQNDTAAETGPQGEAENAQGHIDNRDMDAVGSRSVKAFSFEHPELRDYFAQAAQILINDAGYSSNSQHWGYSRQRGADGKKIGRVFSQRSSPLLDDIRREGYSLPDIVKAAQRIIEDSGQENVAAAKRVELILDDMLTNGYTTSYGEAIPPNRDYIAAKAELPGGSSEADLRERQIRESYELTDALEGPPDAEAAAEREREIAEARAAAARPSAADVQMIGQAEAITGDAGARMVLQYAQGQFESGGMGRGAVSTLVMGYSGTEDAGEYIEGMTRYYNAGRNGERFEAVRATPVLSESQSRAAFLAGENDARRAADATQEKNAQNGAKNAQNRVENARTAVENVQTAPDSDDEVSRESTEINDDPAQHTEAEQRVIEAYKNAVDYGLVEFYNQAKSAKEARKNAPSYELSPVSSRAAKDILEITGIDTDGFRTVLDQKQANHIYLDHGENGRANHTMADANDVGRMQFVIDNYDSIEPAGRTGAYSEPNGRGGTRQAKTVKFSKKVNGTYFVIEAVPDTQARAVNIVTAYMLDKGRINAVGKASKNNTGVNRQLTDAKMPQRNVQNATAENAPVAPSITRADGKGKNKFSVKTDSEGRELTERQMEYFKHSVVRDAEGRLKPMFHGTSSKGFTVFDKYSGRFGLFGKGLYFTDNRSVAEGYTRKGSGGSPGVYEVYLNIQNPVDMDADADLTRWKRVFDNYDLDSSYLEDCVSNEDCFRALKEYCADEGMYKYEAEELITDFLADMGYDGITHTGGGRFGTKDGPEHRVYIAFEPEQIKNTDNRNPSEDADIRYSKSDREILNEYIERFGAIKKGEKPARDVDIPRRTSENQKVSQTVRTVLEAKATPEGEVPNIERLTAEHVFSYTPYSDKAAIKNAEHKILHKGWKGTLDKWRTDVRAGKVDKTNTAIGWALYNNAANEGDTETALSVLRDIVAHQRNAAQAVQATRILKQLNPETQLYNAQKSIPHLMFPLIFSLSAWENALNMVISISFSASRVLMFCASKITAIPSSLRARI